MGARKKPEIWRCPHPYPIEVVGTANAKDKRARCLSCGASGPVRVDSAEAVRALRAECWIGAGGRA